MSIDPNVGALKDYLTDITTSKPTIALRTMFGMLGNFQVRKECTGIVSKMNRHQSALLSQSNLFESLHLRYFGPVDGHDVDHLVRVTRSQKIKGPKSFIVYGKGERLWACGKGMPNLHSPHFR